MNKKPTSFADKMSRNIKHQKEEKSSKFGYLNLPDGVSLLKLKEGVKEVTLDFLLYEVTDPNHPDRDPEYDVAMPGTLWYRSPIKVHTITVNGNREKVICPRCRGKKCPICDKQDKLKKEKAPKDDIVALYPKDRSLYAVIPIDMEGVEEKIYIWDMSDKLFQNTLNEECEIDETLKSFADLENGKTLLLKIRWKKVGDDDKTGFPDIRSIDFEDREPYTEKTLRKVPKLDDLLKILSYEELEKKFYEIESEEDGGELHDVAVEVDERPRRRKTEDDEPEERPARRRRTEDDDEPKVTRSRKEEPENEERLTRRRKDEDDAPKEITRKPKEEEPKTLTRSSKPVKEKSGDGKCPFGHEFGVDADTKVECERCDIWAKCLDEKEGK